MTVPHHLLVVREQDAKPIGPCAPAISSSLGSRSSTAGAADRMSFSTSWTCCHSNRGATPVLQVRARHPGQRP